ncbi:hypothetical protein [Acidithiobacillus sp.]|uniref:hypothetical protein n=1 Tax=Acidithiobacillus sp. TaxID=1872118 RepID=UPI0025B94768|nr:hypothetical protein [Acidithiobacillus sp.]
MSKRSSAVIWLEEPEGHDYPAALSYLSLLFEPLRAAQWVADLASADMTHFYAKDIFRASGSSLLGVSNSHVQKDVKKIRKGIALSPLLLLRDPRSTRLIIADGYHRLCAVYRFDEDANIPCKICG